MTPSRQTQRIHELAPGLTVARGAAGRSLNIYPLGSVVIDSGVRWRRRWLERQLRGRHLTAHVPTHAHFDHAGSLAWLCRTFDVRLWCGAGDADAMSSGRVDTCCAPFNRLQHTLLPVAAHLVGRALREGDSLGGFEVLVLNPAPAPTGGST
jgi:glyoxylase-like metal-dependent hydrolase (beta-lactamase superfamily II)